MAVPQIRAIPVRVVCIRTIPIRAVATTPVPQTMSAATACVTLEHRCRVMTTTFVRMTVVTPPWDARLLLIRHRVVTVSIVMVMKSVKIVPVRSGLRPVEEPCRIAMKRPIPANSVYKILNVMMDNTAMA